MYDGWVREGGGVLINTNECLNECYIQYNSDLFLTGCL